MPGVDGPAATSGLIEFLFATFFGQKWDVVVVLFLPVTSTARQCLRARGER